MMDILTHGGILLISDYLTVFFAFIVTTLIQMSSAQKEFGDKFKLKIFATENLIRWILSISAALFLLYVLPDGYSWYMEDIMSFNEPGTTEWNTMLSAVVGLSPLYILKKLIKVSRSKLRDEASK